MVKMGQNKRGSFGVKFQKPMIYLKSDMEGFFFICGHPEVDYCLVDSSFMIFFLLILETAASIFNGTEDEAHKVIAKTLKYAPDRKTGSGRTGQ